MALGAHETQRQFTVGSFEKLLSTSIRIPLSAHVWHLAGSNQYLLIQVELFTVRVSKSNPREQEVGVHLKHFVLELKVPRFESLWLIQSKCLRQPSAPGPWTSVYQMEA